jgi:hypothetical protein
LHYLITILCTVLVTASGAHAESQVNPSDTLISLGTRIFDLRERSPILDLQVENEFVSLTDVDWIRDMTWSDPLLVNTVIHIKDQTRLHSGGEPPWAPDDRSRFHPDPTLPSIFDLDYYEVGWQGVHEAPVRGDILIFPRHDPKRFYARCGYDRADPKPIFCAVSFRYGPDRHLLVTTRIYQVTSPLNDFAEIAARVEALVRCLDVTEAVRAGEASLTTPYLQQKDIFAGGRCRVLTSS